MIPAALTVLLVFGALALSGLVAAVLIEAWTWFARLVLDAIAKDRAEQHIANAPPTKVLTYDQYICEQMWDAE